MKERINQHDAEGRPHGVWEDYWNNGTLMWREHCHHGTLHGVCEDYRPDGTLECREHWHHGEKKGLAMWWDSQGGITHKTYHLVIR
jgi:antitoxin component YwqK of YwqJK toxin-antitoxin module